MLVSVIVPFYNGEKYLPQIKKMINNNADNMLSTDLIELILVNDSPTHKINEIAMKSERYKLKIIVNDTNSGIHQSRINGIREASGEYILMLDQDDLIEDKCISNQLAAVGNADVIVSNGYKRYQHGDVLIYGSNRQQKKIKKLFWYVYLENRILSPGQCLIKKNAIPTIWTKSSMKVNGADDMFLWLIMLHEKKVFKYNYECLYTHVSTGENISNDDLQMAASTYEMLQLLQQLKILTMFGRWLFKRKIDNDVYFYKNGKDKYLDYKIIEKIRQILSRSR